MLADWAAEAGMLPLPRHHYRQVLACTPQQPEARLGMAELARQGTG